MRKRVLLVIIEEILRRKDRAANAKKKNYLQISCLEYSKHDSVILLSLISVSVTLTDRGLLSRVHA